MTFLGNGTSDRERFLDYDPALDARFATRAFAVYATSVLPVVAELGLRVRLLRVTRGHVA